MPRVLCCFGEDFEYIMARECSINNNFARLRWLVFLFYFCRIKKENFIALEVRRSLAVNTQNEKKV